MNSTPELKQNIREAQSFARSGRFNRDQASVMIRLLRQMININRLQAGHSTVSATGRFRFVDK